MTMILLVFELDQVVSHTKLNLNLDVRHLTSIGHSSNIMLHNLNPQIWNISLIQKQN